MLNLETFNKVKDYCSEDSMCCVPDECPFAYFRDSDDGSGCIFEEDGPVDKFIKEMQIREGK